MKKRVIVIGAGPAGIMAAISASKNNKNVILIDKNDQIGKKLSITGGGRCNVTNSCDINQIVERTLNNGKFLYNSLHTFSNLNLMNFIEENGCKLKVENKGKVFPVSNNAKDIIDLFFKILKTNGVVFKTNCEVKEILAFSNKVTGVKLNDNTFLESNYIILATGGLSYSHLGSTGDGYKFAKRLGHNIVNPKPSLVPIIIKEKWLKDLMGISLKEVRISAKVSNKKKIYSEGDIIFTHYGISGPAVLEFSAYLNQYYKKSNGKITLDLLPSYRIENLNKTFQYESRKDGNKLVKSLLTEFFPKNFCQKLLDILLINRGLKLAELSKKDRDKIINTIKNLNLTVGGFRPIKEAIITSGGVSTTEIDSATMESKFIQGLYFAGEVIDVDSITGGYNLQIAFSTGYVAGANV